jgi:periplasmic protein CpxP/Spy
MREQITAIALAALLGVGFVATADAQMPPPPNPSATNPSIKETQPGTFTAQGAPTPLKAGAAVTENDAKQRLEAQGYTAIRDLKQDNRKNWHAKAQKDGKSMDVSLDTSGTIRARDN